jgi:hypothetical protein
MSAAGANDFEVPWCRTTAAAPESGCLLSVATRHDARIVTGPHRDRDGSHPTLSALSDPWHRATDHTLTGIS